MGNKLKEGETLFADGKIDEAEKYFLSAAENNSDRKDAFNNLGVIAFQKKDSKKAIDYFTRSLEIDPLYKDAILNYTSLLRSLNQTHIAVPLLEKIVEANPDNEEITQLLEDIDIDQSRLKIAILCLPGYETFLEDIVIHLKTKYDVQTCYTNNEQKIESSVEWADIVWLEWANSIAAHVTHKIPSISQKKVICRIHSYEVLNDYLPRIDWSKINTAIFVANNVRDIAFETCPSIINESKFKIIENGVDLQKYSFSQQKPGFNIAVVGSINYKKNPAMWIEIISRLVKLNPLYTLKVAGNFHELYYKYYFENIVRKLGIEENIKFCGRIKDIPGWFEREEINYLLTTSVFESFGYGIAEAMAMGYKPLINNFPGADVNWPIDCTFNNTDELIEILNDKENYDSRKYHDFVKSRYSLNVQLDAIDSMLKVLKNIKSDYNAPKALNPEIQEASSRETNNLTYKYDIYLPQKYWESRGNNYVINEKEYDDGVEIPTLDNLIKKLLLYDSPILEVGSGYGRIYQEIGKKCSNYTMCDFSNSMRRECKLRTDILPDHWDGLRLPYPDNSFDLVILFSVLLHVPDEQIKKFFAEICRVSGNYIFIATYTDNQSITADHVFRHDYIKLFKQEGLKTVFEKKINDGLRANWLVKKQPLATKLESTNIDLPQTST